MPTLSITVTAAQASRIEAALRNTFDADPTKTVAQLAQAFVMANLKTLVGNYEDRVRRKTVEEQLPVIPDFDPKPA